MEFVGRLPADRVQLADLDQLLGERSFGLFLLLFALPNAIPHGLPAVSTITGIPLVLIAFQMLIGMPKAYLPAWLGKRSLRAEHVRRLVERTVPTLRKLELAMKPRWLVASSRTAERLIGAFCLVLAVVLALPIPLGNVLPAIAVVLIALGLIERDGVWITCGVAVGLVSLVAVWGVLWVVLQVFVRSSFGD